MSGPFYKNEKAIHVSGFNGYCEGFPGYGRVRLRVNCSLVIEDHYRNFTSLEKETMIEVGDRVRLRNGRCHYEVMALSNDGRSAFVERVRGRRPYVKPVNQLVVV